MNQARRQMLRRSAVHRMGGAAFLFWRIFFSSFYEISITLNAVDIPTGWNPRTKQQPTGRIVYPACGRAVLFEYF